MIEACGRNICAQDSDHKEGTRVFTTSDVSGHCACRSLAIAVGSNRSGIHVQHGPTCSVASQPARSDSAVEIRTTASLNSAALTLANWLSRAHYYL